jgi:hypothetical protein
VSELSREFDLMLHKRQRTGPASEGRGCAAAGSGGAAPRGPPSTPELDTIMDWLTAAHGPGPTSPPMPAGGGTKQQLVIDPSCT